MDEHVHRARHDGLLASLRVAGLRRLFVLRRRRVIGRISGFVLFPVAPLVFILGEIAIVTGSYLDPTARIGVVIGLDLTAAAMATAEPYLLAADLAEQLGDDDTAIRRLRQAYGLEPGNEEIRNRLRAHGEVPGPTIALAPGR